MDIFVVLQIVLLVAQISCGIWVYRSYKYNVYIPAEVEFFALYGSVFNIICMLLYFVTK